MSLSRSFSSHRSDPIRSIPKGWYWLAALPLSIAMWWAIVRLAILGASALF